MIVITGRQRVGSIASHVIYTVTSTSIHQIELGSERNLSEAQRAQDTRCLTILKSMLDSPSHMY